MKKGNDFYILFWGCMVKKKMVVGSPGIVADTSYDVINMAHVKSLVRGKFIIIVNIGYFFVSSMPVKRSHRIKNTKEQYRVHK